MSSSQSIASAGGVSPSGSRANFAWLVAERGLRLVAGVVVGLWIARHLGPEAFGTLSYVLALVALLTPLAELGLEPIARRWILRRPDEAEAVLAAVLASRLLAGVLAAILLVLYSLLHEPAGTWPLLLIASFALFQAAAATPQVWLQATLRARVVTQASCGVLAAGALAKLWLVWAGAGLEAFVWASVGEVLLGAAWCWRAARVAGLPRFRWGNWGATALRLLKESWPVLASGFMVLLYMRIDLVMLRNLAGDESAGVYAAAAKISEAGYFLPAALAASLLPWLLKRREEGGAAHGVALQRFHDLHMGSAHALVWPTVLLADPLVRLAYGSDYAAAAEVLRWHALAGFFVFSGAARSQVLLNDGRQRFSLLATALGALLNIGLNLWLIPAHGALGAAWATLAAYAVAAYATSWLHPDLRPEALRQTRSFLIPLTGWRFLLRR